VRREIALVSAAHAYPREAYSAVVLAPGIIRPPDGPTNAEGLVKDKLVEDSMHARASFASIPTSFTSLSTPCISPSNY
jgi:hypothetical protein